MLPQASASLQITNPPKETDPFRLSCEHVASTALRSIFFSVCEATFSFLPDASIWSKAPGLICLWSSCLSSRQREQPQTQVLDLPPLLTQATPELLDLRTCGGIDARPNLPSIFDFSGLNHLPPEPRTSLEVFLAGCVPAPGFPWAACWHVLPL